MLELWNDCQKNGVFSTLVSMDKGSPKGLFGLFKPNMDTDHRQRTIKSTKMCKRKKHGFTISD